MTLPLIYVARHGQTEWNQTHRWQGGLDSPLTEMGKEQARRLGRILRREGFTGSNADCLTSPQGRSVETARLAVAPFGVSATPDPRLREIGVGDWAGLTLDEIEARWPGPEDEDFIDRYARAPNGESFDLLWQRVGDLLDSLTRPTVIFTHGMTSRFLRTRAVGGSLADLAKLPGGQGCLFRIEDRQHVTLTEPSGLAGVGKSG